MTFLLGLAGPILTTLLPIILKMVMNSFLKKETKDKIIQRTLNLYVWYEQKTKIAIQLSDQASNIAWQKAMLKARLEKERKAAEVKAKKDGRKDIEIAVTRIGPESKKQISLATQELMKVIEKGNS